MCITCDVKVKGLCWLKVALCFVKEQTIMCYFVAAALQGVLWWNSPRQFQMDKSGNFPSELWLTSCLFVFFLCRLCKILPIFVPFNKFCLAWCTWALRGQASLSQHIECSKHTAYTSKAVSPLDQAGLGVSVRLSCGSARGNLKVLWKTKSGPAAAASCWPTLFRGSRYRLMTGLLLSGPHY